MAKTKEKPVTKEVKKPKVDRIDDGGAVPDTGPFQIRVLRQTDKATTIKIDNTRLTWVYLAKPQESEEGAPKFSSTVLIPKRAEFLAIMRGIAEHICKTSPLFAKHDRKEIFKTAMSLAKYSLLRDGDKRLNSEGKPHAGCANHYTLTAKMQAEGDMPKFDLPLVRADKTAIQKHEISRELYSGVVASIVINIAAYDQKGNQGLTAYLVAVQKLADAPKLSATASDYFDTRSELAEVNNITEADIEGW